MEKASIKLIVDHHCSIRNAETKIVWLRAGAFQLLVSTLTKKDLLPLNIKNWRPRGREKWEDGPRNSAIQSIYLGTWGTTQQHDGFFLLGSHSLLDILGSA